MGKGFEVFLQMKIKGLPGEFGFRALFCDYSASKWKLSDSFYFYKPVLPDCKVKWPVEVFDDGSVYIPSLEELNESHEDSKSV